MRKRDPNKVCSVCGKPHHAKGLCKEHYIPLKNARHYQKNKEAYAEKTRKWRAENPEKEKQIQARTHSKHKEKRNTAAAEYRAANLEHMRALGRAWSKNNLDKAREYNARKRAAKLRALRIPSTELEAFLLREIYALAKLRTVCTGRAWHVDHIVPLQSNVVCGLHCAANLRIVTAEENFSKGNRTWPNM